MANWYAVQIAPGMQRLEKHQNIPIIELEMDRADIECFNPTELKQLVHHRTKKPIHRRFALIPGYVFVTGNFSWPDLKAVKGVQEVLGTREEPLPINNTAIEQLRLAEAALFEKFLRLERARLMKQSHFSANHLSKLFPKNSLVRIHGDLWGGTQAKVTGTTGRHTVKAMVEILGGMVPVEIGVENLERVA